MQKARTLSMRVPMQECWGGSTRSSDEAAVMQASTFIDLSHLSKTEKTNVLLQKGIPFFTIIHLPGHILLYLGKTHDDIFVFHDMWGLRTKNLFSQEGRKIVGKTVITPITFGKQYYDVKKTFLDSADGMRVLL